MTGSTFGCAVKPGRERAAEVGAAQRVERRRQLVGHRAFGQREDAARVPDHVRVARVVHRRRRARRPAPPPSRARSRRCAPNGCGTRPRSRRRARRRAPCRRRRTSGTDRSGRRTGWGRCAGSVRAARSGPGPSTARSVVGAFLVDGAVVAGEERVLGEGHGATSEVPCCRPCPDVYNIVIDPGQEA